MSFVNSYGVVHVIISLHVHRLYTPLIQIGLNYRLIQMI